MGDILTVLGGIATGGLGGVLGLAAGIAQKWIDLKAAREARIKELEVLKENNRFQAEMQDKQLLYLQEEAKNAAALATINAQKEIDVAGYSAMKDSYENDKRAYTTEAAVKKYQGLFAFVDFTRGIMRPLLTFLLDVAAFVVFVTCFFTLYHLWQEQLITLADFETTIRQMFIKTVYTLLFLAEMATGWWFAARGTGGRHTKE